MSTHDLYETVQLFYPLNIEPLDEEKWFDDDYDGPFYGTPDEQIPLLPDIFDAFSTSWQAMNSPHSEQMPDGVKQYGIFFTFDKELGMCVCANYRVAHRILYSTDNFKKAMTEINEDIEAGFDSWISTHFHFKHDGKEFSADTCSCARVVAPVEGHCSLFFKWDGIEDIEDVELALGRDNDVHNILYEKNKHEENVELVKRRLAHLTESANDIGENEHLYYLIKYDRDILKSYEFVETHKARYFYRNIS